MIDLRGQKFGKWNVVKSSIKKYYYLCECECGNNVDVNRFHLIKGSSTKCNLCRISENKDRFKKFKLHHGQASGEKTKTYRTWKAMRQRCNDTNAHNYKWYGGLGIKVCNEWSAFDKFYQDMGDRPEGMTLDRIDPNLNYCKDNCRWANWVTQANNKRKW